MSFYAQVKDLLPTIEQMGLLQLINRIKPLFATQSRPCAELMLAAVKSERLTLIAGDFFCPNKPSRRSYSQMAFICIQAASF